MVLHSKLSRAILITCFMPYYPTRKLTVFALDPSVRDAKGILRTQLEIPNELLGEGPRGCRVHVVDYDATTGRFRDPVRIPKAANRDSAPPEDPFENIPD